MINIVKNFLCKLFRKVRKFASISDTKPTLPTRGTVDSAGYDFYTTERVVIKPGRKSHKIKLNVKCYIPRGEVLLLVPRSSTANKNLMLCNTVGVIDSDYADNPDNEGNIMVQFYNYCTGPEARTAVIEKGERVVQGIIIEYKTCNDDNVTTVRKGGLGSTGC